MYVRIFMSLCKKLSLPHKWLTLVSHQSQGDLTGLSKETLCAHGPHGVDHILGQSEWNHLRYVKCLPLVVRKIIAIFFFPRQEFK